MGARKQSQSPVPSWVGRYEIVRPIARGGMAEVYLARTRPVTGVERLFAIKCCHPHLRDDHEFASMFIEEARLAAQIRHPNVVATFDVGDEEMLYLVMEYVEGEPLSELIKAARKRGERLPLPVTLRIITDALAGLHAAHDTKGADGRPLGVVHRDMSPQNILVGVDGVARIVDFGIAKAEASATVTREGQVKGKLAYLPPEQLTEHVMTRRGDVYAVGVVLWETLTCQRLFPGQNAGEIAMKVLEMQVEPPSAAMAPGEAPPRLDAAVLRALERDPEQRFATAADLAAALESCGVPPASHRTVGEVVSLVHAARAGQPMDHVRAVTTPRTLPVLSRRSTGATPAATPSRRSRRDWRGRPVLLAAAAVMLLAAGTLVVKLSSMSRLQPRTPRPQLTSPALLPAGSGFAAAAAAAPPALATPAAPAPVEVPPRVATRRTKAAHPLAHRRVPSRGLPAANPTGARSPTAPATATPARPSAVPPSEFRPGGV